MPTPQDADYERQGYVLPRGLTWDEVDRKREQWRVAVELVPVACFGHHIAWDVPSVAGVPLRQLATVAAPVSAGRMLSVVGCNGAVCAWAHLNFVVLEIDDGLAVAAAHLNRQQAMKVAAAILTV
jgi:hypothetical protein